GKLAMSALTPPTGNRRPGRAVPVIAGHSRASLNGNGLPQPYRFLPIRIIDIPLRGRPGHKGPFSEPPIWGSNSAPQCSPSSPGGEISRPAGHAPVLQRRKSGPGPFRKPDGGLNLPESARRDRKAGAKSLESGVRELATLIVTAGAVTFAVGVAL